MWNKIAAGAAFLLAIAAAGAFLVAKPAPESWPGRALPQVASAKPFAICKANEVADSRPDPAWVGESFGGDNCRAPRMPVPVDGYKATREQVVVGMTEMKRYVALSDSFQRCIRDFVTARKSEAGRDRKPMDMSLVFIENHRVLVSENNKKKVSDQVKVAINAFNEYGSGCAD
jgi:hypothetical protein